MEEYSAVQAPANQWLHGKVRRVDGGLAITVGSQQVKVAEQAPWACILSDLLVRSTGGEEFPEPSWFGPLVELVRQRWETARALHEERTRAADVRRSVQEWLQEVVDGDGDLSCDVEGVGNLVDIVGCQMPRRTVRVKVLVVASQEVEFDYELPFGADLDDMSDDVVDAASSEVGMYMWEVQHDACTVL